MWPKQHAARRRPGRRSWFLLLPFALAIGVMAVVGWRTWEVRQSQSAAYDRAMQRSTAGNLPAAIVQFGEAGGYQDASEQRVTTQQLLAPIRLPISMRGLPWISGENKRAVELLRRWSPRCRTTWTPPIFWRPRKRDFEQTWSAKSRSPRRTAAGWR